MRWKNRLFTLILCAVGCFSSCSQNSREDSRPQQSEHKSNLSSVKNDQNETRNFLEKYIGTTKSMIDDLQFKKLHLLYMWPKDSMLFCRSEKRRIVDNLCSNSGWKSEEYQDKCNNSIDIDIRFSKTLNYLIGFPEGHAAKVLGTKLKRDYDKKLADFQYENFTSPLMQIIDNIERESSFLKSLQDSLATI